MMSTGPGGTAPYGGDPYGSDSYGSESYSSDQGFSDPYAYNQGSADQSYGDQNYNDPYVSSSSASAPYAPAPSAEEPLAADGFGPQFGMTSAAPAQPYTPGHGYQVVPMGPPVQTSGSAITALVLGILALTFCAGLTAPVGIIFAAKGMKDTSPVSPQPLGGRGLAIAGLVTSLVGILPFLVLVFYIVMGIVAIALGSTSSY